MKPPSQTPDSRRAWVWHPFLFALFPLFSLYASNVAEVSPRELVRPALVLIGLVGVSWLALRAVLKDGFKAALLLLALLVLGFSYTHVLQAVGVASGWSSPFARQRVLMPIWGALLLFAVVWVWRTRRDLKLFSSFLNALGGACLGAAMAQGAWETWKVRQSLARSPQPSARSLQRATASANAPDIFYIILDGYGRADRLREFFDYDNGPFVDELRKRGFFVANRSQSNYAQTVISLASSLNFEYHDAEFARQKRRLNPRDRTPLIAKIQRNGVAARLRNRGYEVVCLSSGVGFVEIEDATVLKARSALTGIEELLFRTTILEAVLQADTFRYAQRRQQLSYVIDHLPLVAERQNGRPPRFVFAHVLAPHPPFVWNARGEAVNQTYPHNDEDFSITLNSSSHREYQRGYVGQVQALNAKVLRAIDGIRARGRSDSVIVIQGDHGPSVGRFGDAASDVATRMAILNALSLPPASSTKPLRANQRPYESLSPVNNFRVVFNRAFDENLPLLPDRAYFSPYLDPYDFSDVTTKTTRALSSTKARSLAQLGENGLQ